MLFNKVTVYTLILVVFCAFGGCGEKSTKKTTPKEKKSIEKHDLNKYPDMVYIPAGEFIMGTDTKKAKHYDSSLGFGSLPYKSETPQRKIYLKGFYIDRYEVTIGEYTKYANATNNEVPAPIKKLDIKKYKDYPMSYVTWEEADDYAEWAKKTLPTEVQWEKAARGTDGRRYPWGNFFDRSKANFSGKGIFPVWAYREDVSVYKVYGMAGSVDEWVLDWFLPYSGFKKGEDDPDFGAKYKVYRGGSWGGTNGHLALFDFFSRCSYRGFEDPYSRSELKGFRCVRNQ